MLNVEAELELYFATPIVIEPENRGGGTINVTLSIDVNRWFVGADGLLIDPRAIAANSTVRQRVGANIHASFHAFEDHDRDGRDDRHGRR
ncbi:MAG TPA: hypothetical protein VIL18_06215 [Longimicrobiales bacterium]